ncbi:Zn(2)-C6 fungal-type domain-containing protein [Mycena kentingensis (nom. inval.)]|nr:Zn(2)-C6 fungal-type domain-containing protein [Mycena kentingensis (nom. inval.)]
MALARPLDPRNVLGGVTCPELAISLRQPQTMAAPGRTLYSFYQRTGNLLEQSINRLAHRLGLGPLALQERIEQLFDSEGDSESMFKQESTLQALRSGQAVPRRVRKYCGELLRFALPSKSACTQLDCFKVIVALSTQHPGLRRVFFDALQHGHHERLTRGALLLIWRRRDAFGSLDDFAAASTFAAECITETCVSAIVETEQPPWLVDSMVAASALTAVERLLVASNCGRSSEFPSRLAIRYLAGVAACSFFWNQEGPLFVTVVLKLFRAARDLVRDLGVQELEGPARSPALSEDAEGVDLLCHSILVGVRDLRGSQRAVLISQPDFSQLVVLTRYPRAAVILPLSWKLSNSVELQALLPSRFTFRSVKTLFLETTPSLTRPHDTHDRLAENAAAVDSNSSFFSSTPSLSFSDRSLTERTGVDSSNQSMSEMTFDSSESVSTSGQITPLGLDLAPLGVGTDGTNALDVDSASTTTTLADGTILFYPGHSAFQENHCIYYFEHVRKMQFIFGGNSITNATCSMLLAAPRGPIINAICALASLHYTRMRVSHGLEAPNPNPGKTPARYSYDEAYFQLHNAKQVRGTFEESDALAALHLVWFSQLSGGVKDWEPVLSVARAWLAQQTNFLASDNPSLVFKSLPSSTQVIIQLTLWLDIFSSLAVMRPPKYFALTKRLFESDDIRMDTITGCPQHVLLGIAEVSALSHWKAEQKVKGALRHRDLDLRREEIVQRLKSVKIKRMPVLADALDILPLHPTLAQSGSELMDAPPPATETRHLVAKIFTETAYLYLHTVMGDSNPYIPETRSSVTVIVEGLQQLPCSEVDRALVFPICLAGCMTDEPNLREFLKGRLLAHEESVGSLMQARLLMEAVWMKRTFHRSTVNWRETMKELGLNLLLV